MECNVATQERKVCEMENEIVTLVVKGIARLNILPEWQEQVQVGNRSITLCYVFMLKLNGIHLTKIILKSGLSMDNTSWMCLYVRLNWDANKMSALWPSDNLRDNMYCVGPSIALYRLSWSICILTSIQWGLWRALYTHPQGWQGPDTHPLWLFVRTPSSLAYVLISRWKKHSPLKQIPLHIWESHQNYISHLFWWLQSIDR